MWPQKSLSVQYLMGLGPSHQNSIEKLCNVQVKYKTAQTKLDHEQKDPQFFSNSTSAQKSNYKFDLLYIQPGWKIVKEIIFICIQLILYMSTGKGYEFKSALRPSSFGVSEKPKLLTFFCPLSLCLSPLSVSLYFLWNLQFANVSQMLPA